MVPLLRFQTRRFDPTAEPTNPINPIPGHSLLRWLSAELSQRGFRADGEPAAEDWGWYVHVADGGFRHLVGASGESAADGQVDWTLQVHRQRGLLDRLRGVGALTPDAPLVVAIDGLLRVQPDFAAVELEWDA